MATSLEELERELRTPLTLGSSPIPQPGLKIGPSQEETAQFVWDMLLKINETAQKSPVLPGVTLGQAREDTIKPAMGQIALAKDYWAKKNKEIQEDTDVDSVMQMFLADTGVDLFEMVPSTEAQLAFEAATEFVPVAKLLAFIPPVMLKRLTKAIDADEFVKVAKEIAEKSPPIKKLIALADGDVDVLKPLVLQARKSPETIVHAGPVKFTGDEVDLRKAGGGSGGDLMGQGLYGTEKPAVLTGVTKGYQDNISWNQAKADPKWRQYVAEARDEMGAIDSKDSWDDSFLDWAQSGARQADPKKYEEDVAKLALEKWRKANPDKGGRISEFTLPEGSIPYITDNTELTPVQAMAMYNAMPNALKGIGLSDEAVERVMKRVHNPHGEMKPSLLNPSGSIRATDKNPDLFMNSMDEALRDEFGSIASAAKAGRNLVNRLRMDIGYDYLEYPSGQVFEAAQGHRNFLVTRPEILRSNPIDEAVIGRRNYEGPELEQVLRETNPDFHTHPRVQKLMKRKAMIRKEITRGQSNFSDFYNEIKGLPDGTPIQVMDRDLVNLGITDFSDNPLAGNSTLLLPPLQRHMREWNVDWDAVRGYGKKVGWDLDSDDIPLWELSEISSELHELDFQTKGAFDAGEAHGKAKNALGRLIRGVDDPPDIQEAMFIKELVDKARDATHKISLRRSPESTAANEEVKRIQAQLDELGYDLFGNPKNAPDRSALDAFEKSVDPIYKELRENALEIGDQESLTLYLETVPLSVRNAWVKLEDAAGIERVGKVSSETFEQMRAKVK